MHPQLHLREGMHFDFNLFPLPSLKLLLAGSAYMCKAARSTDFLSRMIALGHTRAVNAKHVCLFADGSRPQNYREIVDCVKESQCPITASDMHQLVIFRDPREVAVSTYYFTNEYTKLLPNGEPRETVDAYALRILPILCEWISVRHIVFGEYLAKNSTAFWYDEIKSDPVEYHRAWLALVGLHLPVRELGIAVERAVHGELDFHTKGFDPHPGLSTDHPRNRTLEAQLRNDTLPRMEPILQQWLPPVFLSKLGIPLE